MPSFSESELFSGGSDIASSPLLWQKLFESAPDAMLIADDQGYYREANPAACALLELPRQALVGRRIADFLPPGIDFDTVWLDFLAGGQRRGDLWLHLDNGVVKPVEFAATAHVCPQRHLSILREVSDRRPAQTETEYVQQLEQTIAESTEHQQRLDGILNSLDCVVWSIHPQTLETLYVNAFVEEIYGHSSEAFWADATLWFSDLHPEDLPLWMEALSNLPQIGQVVCEFRILRSHGEVRWVRSQARLICNSVGLPIRIDGTTVDISHHKRVELALYNHQRTQQAMLEAIPDLLMRVNGDGYILDLISGGEITLYSPITADQRQSVYRNFPKHLADRRMQAVRRALATETQQRYEHVLEIQGRLRYEESRVVPINAHEVMIIVRDVTERKQAEATQLVLNQKLKQVNAELSRLATIDGLTQIANRRSFDQALDHEWQRARRQQRFLSLILCDIDYFKPYNDNYGHLAGDDCLRRVAQILSQMVRRPGDLVARYGGEEFVLLLPDTSLEGTIQVVEQIQAAMAEAHLPHRYSKISSVLTLSFGLVCQRPSMKEHSPRELVHRADLALYEAKAQGRDCYVVSEVPP